MRIAVIWDTPDNDPTTYGVEIFDNLEEARAFQDQKVAELPADCECFLSFPDEEDIPDDDDDDDDDEYRF
jgi:hypothetical protein